MKYPIVIESGPNNYSAYAPDLPGCVASGKTIEETKKRMRKAIELHIKGIREDGEPIPKPGTLIDYIEIDAA